MEGPDNKTKQPLSATAKNPLSTPAPASDKVPAPSPAPTSTPAPTPASAQASQPAPSAQPETIKSEPVKPALKPETKAPEEKKHDFHSSDIGKWHARQADPFAAQNAARAEKQAKRASAQKKLLPLLIAACALVIAVIVVVIIASQPKPEKPLEITGNSFDDMDSYQNNLQQIYQDKGSEGLQAVTDAVNKTLETEKGKKNEQQVFLAQVLIYVKYGQYQPAIDTALSMNPDILEKKQQAAYYDALYNSYAALSDYTNADKYLETALRLSIEVGNGVEDGKTNEPAN